jgi:hypothetical protein
MRDLNQLIAAVQRNCHIADARHAREATLCTYLLEMREYYRWENGLPREEPPRKDELGAWLSAREALWSDLEDEPFAELPVGGALLDAFDAEAVNARLMPQGFIYGGGYGRFHRPHFFLAELDRTEQRDGLTVLLAGCEYARDVSAPPAVLHEGTVYLRQESVRRWLQEKVELWGMRKTDGALASAMEHYGFSVDPARALERMTLEQTEAIILHEMGEGTAAGLLGAPWQDMLAVLTRRRAELVARAVRDNLADCASTLPSLIVAEAEASIHFYFANFEGMRRALFPLLDQAYRRWREDRDAAALAEAVRSGRVHWEAAGRRLLEIYRESTAGFGEGALDDRIEREEPALTL